MLSHLYTSIYIYIWTYTKYLYTWQPTSHIQQRGTNPGKRICPYKNRNKNKKKKRKALQGYCVVALYCRMMIIIIIIIHRLRFCSDHSPFPPLVKHNSIPGPSLWVTNSVWVQSQLHTETIAVINHKLQLPISQFEV